MAADTNAVQKISKDVDIQDVQNTIRYHMYTAIGVGFIPLPVVDLISLTAVQLNMLKSLADLYGIPYQKETVRGIIGAVIGGATPLLTAGTAASLLKAIPLIGYTTSAVSLSITSGATTYALGWVFAQHFASGGTFLDFDPEAVQEHFARKFEEGKGVAAEAKKTS